jgi:hypothetical protein
MNGKVNLRTAKDLVPIERLTAGQAFHKTVWITTIGTAAITFGTAAARSRGGRRCCALSRSRVSAVTGYRLAG